MVQPVFQNADQFCCGHFLHPPRFAQHLWLCHWCGQNMKKPITILQKDTVLQDSWFFPWFPQVSNSLASSDTCPAHFGRPFLGLWVTGLVRAGRPLQEVLVGHSWPCATEGNILLSSEKQKNGGKPNTVTNKFLVTLIYIDLPSKTSFSQCRKHSING